MFGRKSKDNTSAAADESNDFWSRQLRKEQTDLARLETEKKEKLAFFKAAVNPDPAADRALAADYDMNIGITKANVRDISAYLRATGRKR